MDTKEFYDVIKELETCQAEFDKLNLDYERLKQKRKTQDVSLEIDIFENKYNELLKKFENLNKRAKELQDN